MHSAVGCSLLASVGWGGLLGETHVAFELGLLLPHHPARQGLEERILLDGGVHQALHAVLRPCRQKQSRQAGKQTWHHGRAGGPMQMQAESIE